MYPLLFSSLDVDSERPLRLKNERLRRRAFVDAAS